MPTFCWKCISHNHTNRKGYIYAQRTINNKKRVKMILGLYIYYLNKGVVIGAEGKEGHHVCGNTWCCNPEHLQILTKEEHMTLHGKIVGRTRSQYKKDNRKRLSAYEKERYRKKKEQAKSLV